MKNIFIITIGVLLYVNTCTPCALPYWWSEQFHFPPYYPTGQPRSTYTYRGTFHQTDPNNFVRIEEYSEYTWWEHDTSSHNTPRNFQHRIPNVGVKGGGFSGMPHHSTNNIIPRGHMNSHNTNNIIPRGDMNNHNTNNNIPRGDMNNHNTNNIVPRGDMNGINPSFNTNGMIPADNRQGTTPKDDNHGMVPSEDKNGNSASDDTNNLVTDGDTNGIFPESDVSEEKTKDSGSREGRERNEKEDFALLENMDGNDLEASSESKASYKLPESKNKGGFLSNWFGSQSVNQTEPCKVSETDIHSLRSMIEKMFSFPREHMMHPESKEKAREDILNKFRSYGLQVWTQNFTTPPLKNQNGTEDYREGVNLIGVIPGSQRGHLNDEIVLVGAHYDTVADSNGVDDNGSGLAVMLEIARAITEAHCRLNNTLMFVAFDHEEDGAMGSNYFVDHYLIPEELKRARARFQGAFILDGILNYNDVPNTQELPMDYAESLPGLQYFVNNTGNRGNFLAMISRNEMENHLTQKLMESWQDLGSHQFKLFNLAVDMGNDVPSPPVIEKHLNFLRSDHATFWYHNSSSHFPDSLNAVLLTDTGPFRGQMKECYHSKCDDLTVISPEKLQFAKKTADALTATLVELTSATALGNQLQTSCIFCILQAFIVYYALKLMH